MVIPADEIIPGIKDGDVVRLAYVWDLLDVQRREIFIIQTGLADSETGTLKEFYEYLLDNACKPFSDLPVKLKNVVSAARVKFTSNFNREDEV